MDVALVRRIRRSSGGDPPNDDKERINDGHAKDEKRRGHLRRAEKCEDGQRVRHRENAARPHIDGCRVEVEAQETGECACERKAQRRE